MSFAKWIALAVPGAFVLPLACGEDQIVAAPPPGPDASTAPSGVARTDPDAVHVEGPTFRDGRGRQLLFRGYNAKVAPIFDVTFDDGRTPTQTVLSLDEAGATRFEELGFNVLRLPVSWSGLEPRPREYPEAFLAKIGEVLAMAKRHHVYVIIDMHQDAYSKEIGEDGAPLWAIVPPPSMLLSGPYDDKRRTSDVVLNAGYSFFANANATDGRPLQEAFVTAVQRIAQRYVGDPSVLGYEAFNEPVDLSQERLDAFHERFANGIHAIDRDAPILFEPLVFRNQTDQAVVPTEPWRHGPGAYSPHVYTGQFSIPSQNGWESEDPALLEPSMTKAAAEAAAWQTPLFVTEYGCDQSIARGPKWLAAELDLQDRVLASSTAWVWAETGQWGLRKADNSENAATAKTMARSFPRAVAGDLVAIERPAPAHLRVRYRATARTRGLPHEVSASPAYASNYRASCDGTAVTMTRETGRVTFVCAATEGDHFFEVIGDPAP